MLKLSSPVFNVFSTVALRLRERAAFLPVAASLRGDLRVVLTALSRFRAPCAGCLGEALGVVFVREGEASILCCSELAITLLKANILPMTARIERSNLNGLREQTQADKRLSVILGDL